jgi:hypothetical protein
LNPVGANHKELAHLVNFSVHSASPTTKGTTATGGSYGICCKKEKIKLVFCRHDLINMFNLLQVQHRLAVVVLQVHKMKKVGDKNWKDIVRPVALKEGQREMAYMVK